MPQHKPRYLLSLIFAAVVTTAPQVIVGVSLGIEAYRHRGLPFYVPGVSNRGRMISPLEYATFWHDRFHYVEYRMASGRARQQVRSQDPETGQIAGMGLAFESNEWLRLLGDGDRLWAVGPREVFVVEGGVTRRMQAAQPPSGIYPQCYFMERGALSFCEFSRANDLILYSFVNGAWQVRGKVAVPDPDRLWSFGDTQVSFKGSGAQHFVVCRGDRLHFFYRIGVHVLHREGIDLTSISPANMPFGVRVLPAPEEPPVSALELRNIDVAPVGWSLITATSSPMYPISWYPILIEGEPGIVVVDDSRPGHPVGQAIRREGARWIEFASHEFPFAIVGYHTASRDDGSKSYIVASTGRGASQVFSIDAQGFHLTPTRHSVSKWSMVSEPIMAFATLQGLVLFLAFLLAAKATLLMRTYTTPDYGFGDRTVRLASVWRRGIARMIDLALIALTTAAVAVALSWNLDWEPFLEAVHQRLDHPSVHHGRLVILMSILWLVLVSLVLIVMQARHGATPGKWLCGIRTLQTTLQPCGFARSLARELLLCVDNLNFAAWTPGILCIALTDCRQRVGDLVADTLVVEVRSLPRRMSV